MGEKTSPYDSTAWPNDDQNIGFIITCIEIPLICFAILSLIKSTQAVRVVVINLLIADLIQFVCMLLDFNPPLLELIYEWVVITALHFRMCIAIERYAQIACPGPNCPLIGLAHTLLYGWIGIPLIVFPACNSTEGLVYVISFIPHVVVILCFVCACWSLYHSTSLTPMKKCFALAPNLLMLISYIILTLPIQIDLIFVKTDTYLNGLDKFIFILYMLNPLVDCLLCVFMWSDAENTKTPHCFFSNLKRNQTNTVDALSADVQTDHV